MGVELLGGVGGHFAGGGEEGRRVAVGGVCKGDEEEGGDVESHVEQDVVGVRGRRRICGDGGGRCGVVGRRVFPTRASKSTPCTKYYPVS